MSGKLDQSLDQIMTDSKASRVRKGGKPRPRRAAAAKAKAAIAAPAGGIQKNIRGPRNAGRTAAAAVKTPAPAARGESKIIVSNLPEDVGEAQIKDYFSQMVAPTKRVILTYGPSGRSRGIATVTFNGPESAAKAAKELNGLNVDHKPMRIEVVVGAQQAPQPKTLAERASAPKNAAAGGKANGAKNAGKDKLKGANGAATTNGANKSGRGKKQGRASRPKKKTADELDAEMADYFGADGTATAAPAAAAATAAPAVTAAPAGGEAAMVDEVM